MARYPASQLYPSSSLYPSATVWNEETDGQTRVLPGPYTPRPVLTVCWHPPYGGERLTFGLLPPFVLRDMSGVAGIGGEDVWAGALGQWGASLVASDVLPRTVPLVVSAVAERERDLPGLRRQVAAAFARRPSRPGTAPPLGTLRVTDLDGQQFELPAVCAIRNETREGQTAATWEIDVAAPDPRWRSVGEQHVELKSGGGFTGPIDGPIHSIGGNLTATVNNPGTAPSPLLVRIRGPVTGPSVELVSTGQKIQVRADVTVADGQVLWVDTSFVGRSVTLDGDRAAALLDMASTEFFDLPPGASIVRFAGVDNTGSVVLSWQLHWSGL
jgi:hypothetical protein